MTVDYMSTWARAANLILFEVAYRDERRGFLPMASYMAAPEKGWGALRRPPVKDNWQLESILQCKREFVEDAENLERAGNPMDTVEFNRMCREGFEALLGTTSKPAPTPRPRPAPMAKPVSPEPSVVLSGNLLTAVWAGLRKIYGENFIVVNGAVPNAEWERSIRELGEAGCRAAILALNAQPDTEKRIPATLSRFKAAASRAAKPKESDPF